MCMSASIMSSPHAVGAPHPVKHQCMGLRAYRQCNRVESWGLSSAASSKAPQLKKVAIVHAWQNWAAAVHRMRVSAFRGLIS